MEGGELRGDGGSLEEDEVADATGGGILIAEVEAKFIVGAEGTVLLLGGFAEVVEALAPEFEPAGDGDDAHGGFELDGAGFGRVGLGFEEADVVRDDGVAATLEGGGGSGFTGA